MKYTPHKQVPCKVNAHVDEGIKELVELFNSFENIETIESCQGNPEYNGKDGLEGKGLVILDYYMDWRIMEDTRECQLQASEHLARFAQRIYQAIYEHDFGEKGWNLVSPDLIMSTYICMEWGGFNMLQGDEKPHFGSLTLWFDNKHIKTLTEVIRKLRDEIHTV